MLDKFCKLWYPVSAETNGTGRFVFSATIPQLDIVGKAPCRKRTHVPPFVSATVANLAGGRFAMERERWAGIPGFEGIYEVSDLGRVRSLGRIDARGRRRKPKPLKPWCTHKGYQLIKLYDGQRGSKVVQLHRIVMLAFVGECPPGKEVNHKNCIKSDNRLVNLEYVTPEQNMIHARKKGHHPGGPKGESCNLAKLTEQQVLEIREIHSQGNISLREIGERYNVTKQAIWQIVNRRNWAWL